MLKTIAFSLVVLVACAQEPAVTEEVAAVESECPPLTSNIPLTTGHVMTGNLRALKIDNGIVRLRYGAHAMDFRDTGPVTENTERHADHVLAARHTDHPSVATTPGCLGSCHNGTHWHDAVYSWYGDGIQYSSATFTADADRVNIIEASADAIELAYEWDELRLDGLRAPNMCILGNYPECGPTEKDVNGYAVWKNRNIDQVQSIKKIKFWKTVRLERCKPGYFLSVRSEPSLKWPEQGTRSIRLGYVSSPAAFSCDASHIAIHPNSGFHVPLGVTDCIADVATPRSGTHDGWPFIRFLVTDLPWTMSSLQYSPGQLGSPGVNEIWDRTGPDGRAKKWQAFIGAVEYESPDETLEPTIQALELANDAASTIQF